MEAMLQVGAVFGPLAYLPSVIISVHEHLWNVALVDTLTYGWVVAAALCPHWPYATRVRGTLLVLYLVCLALLVQARTAGAGLLWIAVLPVVAAIFLSLRAAFVCWMVTLVTIAGCGWAMATGHISVPDLALRHGDDLAAWLVTACSALFLSSFVAVPSAILLRGLDQTHRALFREEERFTTVFQLSPEPITISRRSDGCFLDVNGAWCRIFGWTRDEVLGKSINDLGLWPPGEWARLESELEATGGIARHALELNCRDGSSVPVFLSAMMLDLDGEACLLVTAQDRTAAREAEVERRRLELELQHAQKLESLGRLAGGVAHDMNNTLVGILGLASMLQQQHQEEPALAKALAAIHSAGERGRKLVRGLTDFARKGLDDALPVDLNELVRAEFDLLRSTTRNMVELVQDLAPDLPLILGEPSALANALMNLCVNALDAMPDGGVLAIRTRAKDPGQVELSVSDQGHGMSPAVQARAMEPFFTTKPQGKGTGLGLPSVYGAMKAHGGTVELRSKVGQGTQVLLRFPGYAPDQPTPQPELAPSEAAPLRILVVDDDPVIQETLPELLEFLGHSAFCAGSGQEALDQLEEGVAVDLVILDHNMPGLNGTETLLRLRELRPALPVLLSTGFQEPGVEALARSQPKVWLLSKPYSLAGIRVKLAESRT
jgi:PAS domain S-box-containing protein